MNNEKPPTPSIPIPPVETIEVLSTDLLDQNRSLVNDLKKVAKSLDLEFGWHYLLDLTWIIQRLGDVKGKRIMDAGAGIGVLQWYLAEQGATVISVDRLSRANLPIRFRKRFHVTGLRREDLAPIRQVFGTNLSRPVQGPIHRQWAYRARLQAGEFADLLQPKTRVGKVSIYNQDLSRLEDIADNSLDAVVSVSALEHNSQDGLKKVAAEIMRVLKPGSALVATLTAGRGQDQWHEASRAWCYTDESLRRIFELPEEVSSNYADYDELFDRLRGCDELRDHLAKFYFQSGDNGMPWGKWDPQYQPVGVCKIKRA